MKILRSSIFLFSILSFLPHFLQAQIQETELAVVPSKVTVHLKGAELVQTENSEQGMTGRAS